MNFSTFTLKWYFFFQHFPQTNYGGGGTVLLLYSFATIDKMLHAKNHSSFLTNEKSLTHAHKKKKKQNNNPPLVFTKENKRAEPQKQRQCGQPCVVGRSRASQWQLPQETDVLLCPGI